MKKVGILVSDIHLTTPWSRINERNLNLYKKFTCKYDFLILNGDIFDFKWTNKSEHELIEFATQNIKHILMASEKLRVFYILGDNDYSSKLIENLKNLMQESDRFFFFYNYLLIGDSLFFHGDSLLSESRSLEQKSIKVLSKVYQFLLFIGVPFVHKIIFSKFIVVPVIALNIGNKYKGVNRIYTGHTHVPYNSFSFFGVKYSNTGSSIKKYKFSPIFLELDGQDVFNHSGY